MHMHPHPSNVPILENAWALRGETILSQCKHSRPHNENSPASEQREHAQQTGMEGQWFLSLKMEKDCESMNDSGHQTSEETKRDYHRASRKHCRFPYVLILAQ